MRVLFVSTYEKMGREINRLKEEFEGDDIDVIDLQNMSREEAVDCIRASGCDIVISRGGAYRFIKERVSQPVIPIEVTVYDIINILDFSQMKDTLIVGMREITESANRLNELTNVKLHIISLNHHDELYGREEEIKGYKTVYSDYNSHVYLESRGIRTRLIESSYQSIKDAYIRAGILYGELAELRKQERILDAYLSDENKNVYLYQGRKLYIRRITNPLFQEEIEGLIEENLPCFLRGRYLEKCLFKNEYFIRIYNHHFRSQEERLTAVKVEFVKYPRALADMTFQKEGMENYHMAAEEREELLLYAASSLPVVISAFDEILKRRGFTEIIGHSKYSDSTPFYIRFGMYTEKEIRRLFEDENSVLNLSHHVIIFDGVESLDSLFREMLKNYFLDSRILATNKIVLAIRRKELLEEIMSAIPYHFVHLSAYYERRDTEEIIRSNLEEFGLPAKDEIVEALRRRRFVTEMDLKRALANEKGRLQAGFIPQEEGKRQAGALRRPEGTLRAAECLQSGGKRQTVPMADAEEYLEQVGLEYALRILQEENGNRTRTAQRLGIGRTTLWRMLKQVEDTADLG